MKLILVMLMAAVGGLAQAAGGAGQATGATGAAKFLTLEDAALAQAKKWQKTGVAKPIMSDDGKVVFPFGQYMPTVTCAPLRACDIELEPGEIVRGKPLVGDGTRWLLSKAESGVDPKLVTHVVVKPTDTGLDTNLIIPTDKRTYHIRLYSGTNEGDYVNRVGFYYPQDMSEQWDESERLAAAAKRKEQATVVTEMPSIAIDRMDFGYRIEGDEAAFKPARVFNEGTRVFIEMPESMRSSESPILMVMDKAGTPQLVNYRPLDSEQGGRKVTYYVVDKLFDKAVLVIGTDNAQSKVTITWLKTEKKGWFW